MNDDYEAWREYVYWLGEYYDVDMYSVLSLIDPDELYAPERLPPEELLLREPEVGT